MLVKLFEGVTAKVGLFVLNGFLQHDIEIDLSKEKIFLYQIDYCWEFIAGLFEQSAPVDHALGLFDEGAQKMVEKLILTLISFDLASQGG